MIHITDLVLTTFLLTCASLEYCLIKINMWDLFVLVYIYLNFKKKFRNKKNYIYLLLGIVISPTEATIQTISPYSSITGWVPITYLIPNDANSIHVTTTGTQTVCHTKWSITNTWSNAWVSHIVSSTNTLCIYQNKKSFCISIKERAIIVSMFLIFNIT